MPCRHRRGLIEVVAVALSLSLVTFPVALVPGPAQASTLIQCNKLIDVANGRILSNVLIRIEEGRFASVEAFETAGAIGLPLTSTGAFYRLRDHTCMPGLMDMHTHLSFEYSPESYLEQLTFEPGDYAFRMVGYAERTLMAGFTTVRDLGDHYNLSVALRDAIEDGHVIGPRIFTSAKAIATTGGHADPTNGVARAFSWIPGPAEGVADGPYAARQAVRQRYKDGADLIKITATGGVLSVAKSGDNPQFMADELAAIVAAARDYGMTVAVHAHGTEGMKRAIRAGVDSIEHGTFMDDEAIELFKRHGTAYVPTISAGMWVGEKADIDGFFPSLVRPKARRIGPQIAETFARAHAAGVTIAFGTDSGVSPHGENAKEFKYMVDAGMTPMAAIQSATVGAARLLRVDDELGRVETGMVADLIAVEGDPLADITRLQAVTFVMKAGRVYTAP